MTAGHRLAAKAGLGLWLGLCLALGVAGLDWSPLSWYLLVLGVLGVMATGVARRTSGVAAVRWFAGLAGATCLVWFHHLNYTALAQRPGWVVGLSLGFGAACAAALPAARGPWLARVWAQLRGWPAAVLALAWLYATARWCNGAEWHGDPQFVFRGLWPLLATPLAGLLLVAAAKQLPPRTWPEAPPWLPLALVLAGAALTAAIARYAIGPLPHVEDEIAYLFQAKTLSLGRLTLPAPPVPGAFDARFAWVFMDDGGRTYGLFPPGWPLLLAIGVKAGAPWLVNTIVSALAAWLWWRQTSAEEDRGVAIAALALLVASPFYLIQGAAFFAHPATLLWIVIALGASLKCARAPSAGAALLAGLAVGACCATRYVEGVLLGLVVAGHLGAAVARRRVPAWLPLLVVLGAVPGLGLATVDNLTKTGSARVTPVERWYTQVYGAPVNRPGFGPDRGLVWDHSLGPGHSVLEGLWNVNYNAWELNRYGLGWACGSLLLALVFGVRGRWSEADRLWGAYGALLLAAYVAYWYHCVAYGPRVLHPLLPALALFTAKGAHLVAAWVGPHGGPRVRDTMLLAALTAGLAWLPLELQTTYYDARGREAAEARIVPMARSVSGGRPCVVVRHMQVTGPGQVVPDYGISFSLNPPGLDGPVLVVRELDQNGRSQLAAIRRAYPERLLLLWYREAGADRLVPLPEDE